MSITRFVLRSVAMFTLAVTLSEVVHAQFLYREAFDSSASENNWGVNATGTDFFATFGVDYLNGAVEQGFNPISVPEAPNSNLSTDAANRGLVLEANTSAAALTTLSVYPTSQNFTGNYQLRFDAWMNYDLDVFLNAGAAGTTEFIGGGIGYDGTKADVGSGAQLIATGDGGSGSDYRAFKDRTTVGGTTGFYVAAADMAGGSRNNTDPYYADFLPGMAPPAGQSQPITDALGDAGTTGFQWLTWEFKAVDNVVDVTLEKPDGSRLLIVTLDGNDTSDGSLGFSTDGNIMLFYADYFSSVTTQPQWTFGLIDNVEVTEVIDTGLDGDYNDDDVVDMADYTAWRDNLGAAAGTLPNDPNSTAIGDDQYNTWKQNFGLPAGAATAGFGATSVPEPSTIVLCLFGAALAIAGRRRAAR